MLGGQPSRFLPNASGLTWIGDRRLLFSEIKHGSALHMGVVTSAESRAESREIYFPAHERAMAHYSYASPDRRSVLVVEMARTGEFQRCRLAPFDGSVGARDVGPDGKCLAAGWSPDGRWMYFSAIVAGTSHLWRQHVAAGPAEQMTFGPTEEEGIAVALDGKSLITAVGVRQSAVWIHDAAGERSVSSEGFAFKPSLSSDGKRLYYLLRQNAMSPSDELCSVDLASGRTDHLLPGFSVADYDISKDERDVVFSTAQGGAEPQIWIAPLDRRSSPRPLTRGGDTPVFGGGGEVIFRQLEAKVNFLSKINKDGSGRERIGATSILELSSVSPDGEWALVRGANPEGATSLPVTVVIPVHGGAPRVICSSVCRGGWSADGRFLYLSLTSSGGGQTALIPVPLSASLPDLPPSGADSDPAWLGQSSIRIIDQPSVSPGPGPSTYAFTRGDLQRNLYRIPLR